MPDTKEWVLPNGFTYIASTAGYYGSDRIIPIGFFQMSKNSMKVSKDSRLTNHEFVTKQFEQFRKSYDWWVENEQKQ